MAVFQLVLASCIAHFARAWGTGDDFIARSQAAETSSETIPETDFRIVGGKEVPEGIPWMASIGKIVEDSPRPLHFCGASLIAPDYVITAAHCMLSKELSELTVSIGGLDQTLLGTGTGGWEERTISKATCHPQYNSMTEENDICILKLNKPSTKTPVILNTDPMGTPNNAPNQFETPGTKGYVLGWGAQSEVFSTVPNMLQGVQIPIIGLEECKKQVPKWQYEVVDERSICGGYPQGGKDACSGDSGGPYVTLDSNILIGITSWGVLGCARPNKPGIYQRISFFVPWIESVVGPLPKAGSTSSSSKSASSGSSGSSSGKDKTPSKSTSSSSSSSSSQKASGSSARGLEVSAGQIDRPAITTVGAFTLLSVACAVLFA